MGTLKCNLHDYDGSNWTSNNDDSVSNTVSADLVLCFGSKKILSRNDIYSQLSSRFLCNQIAMCTTSGEIFNTTVQDDSLVALSISFAKTKVVSTEVNIWEYKNSYDAGLSLTEKLPKQHLKYVLVLSDGSLVNGSELVKGLNQGVDNKILVTGGLAGDGSDFKSTLVGINNNPSEGKIIAIGFYGNNLVVTHGSGGGWDEFGLEKTVTKSANNKLFQLDGKSCLEVYKKYLGNEANNLPASALLFPLSVILPGNTKPVVRTILSISEEEQSMTFAGDIPEGSKVKFMKANFDSLISAVSNAAQKTKIENVASPDFSLLISCIGRKLVLGSRIDEELEFVNEAYSGKTPLIGFYSYGEISPLVKEFSCELHNQTMTITSFYEF